MSKDLARCDWVITVRNFADTGETLLYKLENKTLDEVKEMIMADAEKWIDDDESLRVEVDKLEPFGWWCGACSEYSVDYQIVARPYVWLSEYTI